MNHDPTARVAPGSPTNHDLPPLPGHPEHGWVWTEAEQRAIRAYAAQAVAAERERIFAHIRSAMGHAEAGYDDVAWRLLASLVAP